MADNPDLFSFVKDGLAREKGRWREIADASNVSYSWISKCGAGKYDETNVGHRTLERVAAVLRERRA